MDADSGEELAILRRQLAETYKLAALGRLMAGVAHEMNTPMGSLTSNNALALRSLESLKKMLGEARATSSAPPQKALDVLDTLLSLASVDQLACQRLASIVRGLRTLARTNQKETCRTRLDMLMDDTLKLASSVFRHRITVEKNYGEIPEVECYPQLLGQVFLNLLVNAAQAIEGEGTITVTTRQEGDQAHIAIHDTGKGIAEEDKPKIFTPGFSTKPAESGTGLGLAISREIVVDNHHGTIDFESQPGGTTFHVRIPITQAHNHGN